MPPWLRGLVDEGRTEMKALWSNRCPYLFGSMFLCLAAAATASPRQGRGIRTGLPKDSLEAPAEAEIPLPVVRPAPDEWAPPDVDAVRPPVAEGIACPLDDVVSETGARVEEFLDNLNRVTATESVQHQTVNRSGALGRPEVRKYQYLASVSRARDGTLSLDEYRRSNADPVQASNNADDVSVENTFIHLVIFHPHYARNFRLTCEGLGTWKGQPTWQIHFEERPDRENRMNVLILYGRQYSPRVRGRAWVLTDSYQVVRVETDLVEPMPEVQLRLWHQVIDYCPRAFGVGNQEVWLPLTSELYMDFRKHRFYRRHSYNDFHFFSVNVHQEFGSIW